MGCFYGSELISQEKIIEILVDKKKRSAVLIKQPKLDTINYEDIEITQLQKEFYEDINDESKLVKYLNKLQKDVYKEKFDYELLIYFDSLSPINRTFFSGISGFESCFDIFKQVINKLKDFDFNGIKDLDYFKDFSDLCGREKLINSDNFTFKSKFLLQKGDKNYSQNKKIIFSYVEKSRRYQKISLKNIELFFNNLLQSYFESIAKANNYRLEKISRMVFELYEPICSYLARINNKEEFSDNDYKIINILLYAPIIGNNTHMDVYRMIYSFDGNDNDDDIDINTTINNKGICKIVEDKLILYHIFEANNGKNELEKKLELENPGKYNINLINKEITKSILRQNILSELDFIKYVKLQFFQENNFYTYNKIYHEFNTTLFKNILHSKTIKSVFDDFYPNKEYIFDKEEIINDLLNSIIFVPFPMYEAYGITNKKTLLIFISGLINEFNGSITYLGKSCSFIILGLHEGCVHWASAFYSYLYQDLLLFRSNKFSKEILIEMGFIEKNDKDENSKNNIKNLLKLDGGDILEILLFGRKLEFFSLNEILFLLCKKSYDVDYKTFKKNFKEANEKNLLVLYNEVIEDAELKKFFDANNIDINFFELLEKQNSLYFSFKRNGDILSNSKCGNYRF